VCSPLLDGVVGVPEVEFSQAVLPHVQQVGQPQLPIRSRLRPQPGPPQPATSEERHQPTATRDTLCTAQPVETSLQQACLVWSFCTRRWHRTALLKDNTLSYFRCSTKPLMLAIPFPSSSAVARAGKRSPFGVDH
jgi:hypothetical protein